MRDYFTIIREYLNFQIIFLVFKFFTIIFTIISDYTRLIFSIIYDYFTASAPGKLECSGNLNVPVHPSLESPPPGQDQTISYNTGKVYPSIYWYEVFVPTCTGIYRYIPNRHGIYLYILYQRNDGFSIVGTLLSCRIMHVYTSHIQ